MAPRDQQSKTTLQAAAAISFSVIRAKESFRKRGKVSIHDRVPIIQEKMTGDDFRWRSTQGGVTFRSKKDAQRNLK